MKKQFHFIETTLYIYIFIHYKKGAVLSSFAYKKLCA